MTPVLDRTGLDQFRTIIARRLGLQYEDGKLDYLAEVARRRMELVGSTRFESYLDHLISSPKGSDEFRALAEELTVNETFFFRNADNFRAFCRDCSSRADSREDPGEATSHPLGRMCLG